MRIFSSALTLAALAACGSPTHTSTTPVAPTPAPVVVPERTAETPDAPTPAPVVVPEAGAATEGASKFTAWSAVHALMSTPVKLARAQSATDAVALTSDNLVGVTTNGGASWGFVRLSTGTATTVAGAAGGPWMAVGKNGFAAWTADGKTWQDLPRYTNEELVAVAVDKSLGATAITKSGVWVHWSADGKSGAGGVFPDKAKPAGIIVDEGQFKALAGKTVYASADGTVWAGLPAPAATAAVKGFPTSQGICNLGKVEKNTGVVCEVKGQAYGTSDMIAVVPGKGAWFTTADGGGSWAQAAAPMPAANGVVQAGQTLVAYGAGGAIWKSSDNGATWTSAATDLTKPFKTHWTDGTTIVLAGDGGAIARSADGGATFTSVVTTATGGIKQLAKLDDGRLVASLGAKGLESTDGGATWIDMVDPAPLATLVPPAKAGKCEGRQPAAGEVCAYTHRVTSPAGLPNAKGLSFTGQSGLAWGDSGLLLMTGDGGKSWNAASGKGLKALNTFAVGGNNVIGTSGRWVIVSTDGGQSWNSGELPKEAGAPWNSHVTSDGTLWIVGANGTVIRGMGGTWTLCDLGNVAAGGKKVTTGIAALHEAGGTPEAGPVIYAVGGRGEMWRSENRGDSWDFVATGTPNYVQKIAADGDTVVAVTYVDRNSGNFLLKSDDGGRHFYVAREVSDQGQVDVLTLAGGELTYNDRVSKDFGATWTRPTDKAYWGGGVDIGDGSGMVLYNRGSKYVRDTLYLASPTKDDYVIIDAISTKLALFDCSKESGCWMLAGGQLYRPL